jgi:hypothetical protein
MPAHPSIVVAFPEPVPAHPDITGWRYLDNLNKRSRRGFLYIHRRRRFLFNHDRFGRRGIDVHHLRLRLMTHVHDRFVAATHQHGGRNDAGDSNTQCN